LGLLKGRGIYWVKKGSPLYGSWGERITYQDYLEGTWLLTPKPGYFPGGNFNKGSLKIQFQGGQI